MSDDAMWRDMLHRKMSSCFWICLQPVLSMAGLF